MNKKIFISLFSLYLLIRVVFFLLFPLYPDEVAVDWWLTSDVNNAANIIVACNNGITSYAEIFNIFKNIELFQNNIIYYLRIKSLIYYLLFVISSFYLYKSNNNNKYIYLVLITTIAPFSVTFILNRPEAFIFYFVFYFLFYLESKIKYKIFLYLSLYFFIISSISHPKTLYFSLIYFYAYKDRVPLLALIGLVDFFSYKYWGIRMSCADPEILKFYGEFNINPLDILNNFKDYMRSLYQHNFCTGSNFDNCRWSRFFNNSYFNSNSDAGVYAPVTKNYLFQNLPKLIYVTLFLFAIYDLVKKSVSNYRIGFLLFPILIHLLHNRTQNFYDLAFWYSYVFGLFIYFTEFKFEKISRNFLIFILVFCVILDFNYFYRDFLHGYQGPSRNIKFLHSENKALNQGGYTRDSFKDFKILVLDDSTFRYFEGSNRILITYYNLRNKNMLEDIKSKESIAIATRCVFFNEYKLESLNPTVLKISDEESLCFYVHN